MKKIIDSFIYPKDKEHPETYRKGRFFLVSFFIFLVIGAVGEVFILATDWGGEASLGPAIGNGLMCAFVIGSFFVYRKYGGRIILVNVVSVMGFMSNFGTYNISGGIFSSDLAFGIVVCCWIFLVADKISGLVWFGITFASIIFFGYAAANNWKDFGADVLAQTYAYPFFNFLLACSFTAVVIWLHERNKEAYLKELNESKSELEKKSKELEIKNEDIISSINYAKRIQYAVLPGEETITRSIPLSFILYKPKDIVSGDFFWFHEIDRDNYIIVCADCTGHGVPGALMTVVGSNLLTQVVSENRIFEPGEILSELDKRITLTLKQEKVKDDYVHDGMDLALVRVNKAKKEFVLTSAKRPAIFIRNRKISELKGSKNTLGGLRSGDKIFEEIRMNYEEDDMLYLFTDGYIDQFGGPGNKKFMIKRFRELLLSAHTLPMNEQKHKLQEAIVNWIGPNEQTDDITVIGIRF